MELKKVFCPIVLVLFCCSVYGQPPEATVSMKDYVDMQSELNKELMLKIIEIQNDNINDNVIRANAAMDKRLDGMNEFRDTLKDQSGTFVTWPALLGLVIGLSGLFFGYSNFKRNENSSSKNIQSGDKVEVKK